jgi:hypothetical protein
MRCLGTSLSHASLDFSLLLQRKDLQSDRIIAGQLFQIEIAAAKNIAASS